MQEEGDDLHAELLRKKIEMADSDLRNHAVVQTHRDATSWNFSLTVK